MKSLEKDDMSAVGRNREHRSSVRSEPLNSALRICGHGGFLSWVVTMRRRRRGGDDHDAFRVILLRVAPVFAAAGAGMTTSAMAVTCSASGFSALSSCSSSFQAGCSSSTQELTSYSHRACQSALGSGIYTHRGCTVQVRAGKGPPKQGRGYSSKKAAADGIRKIMRGRDADNAFDGWTQVLMQEELPEGKNKAIIHNNAGYVLVKRDDALYAIQASCTSCKFPIIEGEVGSAEGAEDGTPGDAQIKCPLCHTEFSLEDGKVTEYCPKDGPIAWAIGTLKSKETPIDAKDRKHQQSWLPNVFDPWRDAQRIITGRPSQVYSARISKSGRVYVRFATASTALP